jgi:RND superfamily putative drug exporter
MAMLGDRNWYLPKWLSWLPDLRIEGEPAREQIPMPVPVPGPATAGAAAD